MPTSHACISPLALRGVLSLIGAPLLGCEEPLFPTDAAVLSSTDAAAQEEEKERDGGPPILTDARTGGARDAATDAGVNPDVPLESAPDAAPGAREGGAADAAVDDAAASGDAPAWASRLVGRYAVSSVVFSENQDGVAMLRERHLVQIRKSGESYELIAQLCEARLRSATVNAFTAAPEKLAQRLHRISFEGDKFTATPVEFAVGFDAEAPECRGEAGERVPKRAYQEWIAGTTCRCPGDFIPLRDDCRVLDPDGDKLPGYLIQATLVRSGLLGQVWGVAADYSKFVQAELREDGSIRALKEQMVTTQQFGCRPDVCPDGSGPAPTCPAPTSRSDFVNLKKFGDATVWDCKMLVNRAAELFPGPEPPPPLTCAR